MVTLPAKSRLHDSQLFIGHENFLLPWIQRRRTVRDLDVKQVRLVRPIRGAICLNESYQRDIQGNWGFVRSLFSLSAAPGLDSRRMEMTCSFDFNGYSA